MSRPISNEPDFRRIFSAAQSMLESMGYDDIVNPAELCNVVPNNYPYDSIMTICIDLLNECDAVLFLPGWKQSHGCGVEYGYALATDKITMDFEDFVMKGGIRSDNSGDFRIFG